MAPRTRVRRGARLSVRRIGGTTEWVEHAPGAACAALVRTLVDRIRACLTAAGCVVISVAILGACPKRDVAPPASWEPDRMCSADEDCAPAPSCCPSPCSGDVINKKDLAKMQAR